METNLIKSFAKDARILLLDGVMQRLTYWGFNADGHNDQKLQATQGGYIFRGQVHTDVTVPAKWNKLKKRLTDKQALRDVLEEAAYTWFNRLMAIKILEANGYIDPVLQFAKDMHTPLMVQNAKKGQHQLTKLSDKNLLIEYLKEDQEENAFGLLVADLCNRNKVLHDIFGRIDDYTELLLPQNLLQKNGLLDLINSDAIRVEDYKEVELIGWLYQFYISDKKDEVFAGFKKNKKARAEDIPAATQIFTPKWIVKYMVENTVGKIYLDYEPASSLREDMKYLVESDTSASLSVPIIKDVTELTLIDPACGSGHILVTGFELLFKMYREEGYTAKQAVENILDHNLFGLDIDDRAMQLARFAVLLKAAEFDAEILHKGIIPHIYGFPEEGHFTSEELQLFLGYGGQQYVVELKEGLQLLNQGKNLGSALKLNIGEKAYPCIQKKYLEWSKKAQTANLDLEQMGIFNRLRPFLEVLLVLGKKYAAAVANPPYLGPRNMNGQLKQYVDKNYPLTKSDLFATFIEISLELIINDGSLSMINQESWLFNSSYKLIRNKIVKDYKIINLLHLGTRTFDEVSGEKVRSVAFTMSKAKTGRLGTYFRLTEPNSSAKKEQAFLTKKQVYNKVDQSQFKEIEGTPFAYWISLKVLELFKNYKNLAHYSSPRKGNSTSDNDRFLRLWYEVNIEKCAFYFDNQHNALRLGRNWIPYNKGGGTRKWYGYNEYLIDWTDNGNPIREIPTSVVTNEKYYMKPGLTWSAISSKTYGLRYFNEGFIFDNNGCCLFDLKSNKDYLAGLLNSKVFFYIIGQLNPALAFHPGDVKKFPIILNENRLDTIENYKISKKDWDSRETSWDFEQPLLLNDAANLSQAYQTWQSQVTQDFFQLHTNEEELNRIFIDIYGLQDELTPEVALKDITILQEELAKNDMEALEETFRTQGKDGIVLPINKSEVISQFISYAIGVFMGRYRLDRPGLHIAHPDPTEQETAAYTYNGHTIAIDDDAILPLMGDDCAFPDDALVRTKDLIHAVWGEPSLTENINFVHDALGMELHKWLTERFWGCHTKMYKKKPIYWLFSSNTKKPQNAAFKVLVYMHRMDKYTVQKIQRQYLHSHQEYINRELEKLTENEENLGKLEIKRLEQLHDWVLECRDYNEVLKALAVQEIEFDLDDGVSVNYEKFEGAVAKI